MSKSWFALLLFVLTGCSTFHTHKPDSAVTIDEEDAFYIPRSIEAVGIDPMSTVYTYSKSDIVAAIFFDFDKVVPNIKYVNRVESAASFFKKNLEFQVLIVGHCDHFGSHDYNNNLGLKRAECIKEKLIEAGIDESRITVASVGSEQAKEKSTDKNCTMVDRRVDIVLLEHVQN